jgi:hypothetical protein
MASRADRNSAEALRDRIKKQKNLLEFDLAAARPNSQYRLRFSLLDTDNDGDADAVAWTDAELSGGWPVGTEPKLIVTYLP